MTVTIKNKRALPAADLLRRMIDYRPETGKMFWRVRTPDMFVHGSRDSTWVCNNWNARFAGSEITLRYGERYFGVRCRDRTLYAHRIIWKLVHGSNPDTIDHINGDGHDNRLVNLRSVTPAQNMRNLRFYANNTSGHNGVRLTRSGTWQARYGPRCIGTFKTKEAAIDARKMEEVVLNHRCRG